MSLQELCEPSPIEIDPRPCEWCGLTIDQHIMVDDGDGPEFFCEEIHPYAANLVLQWELQDPRDAWRHTGEIPPPVAFRNADFHGVPSPARQQYRTPQSVVDAFFSIARHDDVKRLRAWLSDHPKDAPHLLTLLEGRQNA